LFAAAACSPGDAGQISLSNWSDLHTQARVAKLGIGD
jgi:hypothetical protein